MSCPESEEFWVLRGEEQFLVGLCLYLVTPIFVNLSHSWIDVHFMQLSMCRNAIYSQQ